MSGHYANTPFIWPMLITASALLGMAVYAWRHRAVPGARPLAATLGFAVPWAIGAALEVAAVDLPTRVFWFRFQTLWPMAAVTAGLWFALEYASLDRYLTTCTFWLLTIPPVATALLVLTDSAHHLVWRAYSFGGYVRAVPGPMPPIFLGVGYTFAMASSLVFLWLFVHSPLHRWPAALCLVGQIAARVGFALDVAEANPLAPMDVAVLGVSVAAVMYAIAVFRFGMFAVVPIGRGTVIERMTEGVLILDVREAVMDLNPAAERILGLSAKQARGRRLRELLPSACAAWEPPPWDVPAGEANSSAPGHGPDAAAKVQLHITTGSGEAARTFALRVLTLANRRSFRLGYLVLLQDVTQQLWAQVQIVDQQRALATLRERDRVARELHDGLGQVLGYLKMQAHTARLLLARGQPAGADDCLAQMQAAAQETHADIREFILGSGPGPSGDSAFLPSLERYVRRFGETYRSRDVARGPARTGQRDPRADGRRPVAAHRPGGADQRAETRARVPGTGGARRLQRTGRGGRRRRRHRVHAARRG